MTSSPSQQYCLRWNNYQNNLTNVFDQLLQSEAFVDVTLACEGHSLKAHKVVLSACSPYFQSLFFDNPCKHPIVILNGIKWDELKSVVEFMYRGEINVSQDQLAPLLKVAEVLKIRGLADVSRVGPSSVSTSSGVGGGGGSASSSRNNPEHHQLNSVKSSHGRSHEFNNTSLHDSGSESPSSHLHHLSSNGNPLHPLLQQQAGASSSSPGAGGAVALSAQQAHQMLASLSRRKRRKMSTPERTPSPTDDMDDHSNQLEIDSTNGDYDRSPGSNLIPESPVSSRDLAGVSMSLTPTSSGNLNAGGNLASLANSSAAAAASLGPIGPALLNLHAAAAAAAAVAANSGGNGGNNGSGGGGNHHGSSSGVGGGSSSVSNDLDIKPGIVEMIREEERAKMLESAHGWLGPSSSTLSESYQYQIQNLWQKCWNQNQTGMMHALRFRERGPLKSWRPETMAEAIFAVLREGLSLSQAARKYDIPYPTFVLYANRVHNMLGPSADGSSNTDLMSDMRPKGRGRPQRILLGTWPEEHIRGVIRAVVFRDTQTKDDIPAFVFNRDGGLCLSSSQSGGNNGLDMSLHPQFLGGNSPSPFIGTPPPPSSSAGQSSSSQGGTSTAPSPLPSSSSLTSAAAAALLGDHLHNQHGGGGPSSSSTSDRLSGAHQHLQIQMSQGNSASSSASSSPLQQALNNSTALSGIGAQAQSQLLALQQRHLQQQLQLHQQQRRTSSESPSNTNSKYNGNGGGRSSSSSFFHRSSSRSSLLSKEIEKELLARSQIKTELLPSPYNDNEDNEEEEEDLEESGEVCGRGLLPRPGGISSGLTRGISIEEDEDEEGGGMPVESSLLGDGEPLNKSSKVGGEKSLNNNNDLKKMNTEEDDDEGKEEDTGATGEVTNNKSPSSPSPLESPPSGEFNEGGLDLIPTVSNSPSPRSLLETKSTS